MSLEDLLQRAQVWRAGRAAPGVGLASGFAALDAILPGGGWPTRGLTEILATGSGIGALRLVLPALARLSREGRWIIWVAPPHIPYSPALSGHGLDLSRVLVVDFPEDERNAAAQSLWAYEQALRFDACGAALLWVDRLPQLRLRRLQLAAESGATWGLLFRPAACAAQASPATMEKNSRPLSEQIGGSLNPTWVEWLMGFPLEWTALKASATRSSRRSRK